jgi:hypothetical protein
MGLKVIGCGPSGARHLLPHTDLSYQETKQIMTYGKQPSRIPIARSPEAGLSLREDSLNKRPIWNMISTVFSC